MENYFNSVASLALDGSRNFTMEEVGRCFFKGVEVIDFDCTITDEIYPEFIKNEYGKVFVPMYHQNIDNEDHWLSIPTAFKSDILYNYKIVSTKYNLMGRVMTKLPIIGATHIRYNRLTCSENDDTIYDYAKDWWRKIWEKDSLRYG